jgi:hypothetical protein
MHALLAAGASRLRPVAVGVWNEAGGSVVRTLFYHCTALVGDCIQGTSTTPLPKRELIATAVRAACI